MGANGGFTRCGFVIGGVWWSGVVFTVVVWMGVVEVLGPTKWFWVDLVWKDLKWWRSWKSGGVEGEDSLLELYCKSKGSRSVWSILVWDLILKRFFVWCKSNWGSCKAMRFSGTKFVLWMVLIVVKFPDLEVCHKIFSGSSTMLGGFGSGWDLILILCEAKFQISKFREAISFSTIFWRLTSLNVW